MKTLLLGLLAVGVIACSDSGGNGNGAPGYNHNDLAKKFVQELNLDSEFNVELVKKSTLKSNFVVIYDPYTDSYDALNLDNYDPATGTAVDYYNNNSSRNYFDLDVIPGYYDYDYRYEVLGYDEDGFAIWGYEEYIVWVATTYRDRHSGMTFEKVSGSTKDIAKMIALKEAAEVAKSAEFLSSEFGLSLSRGKELASLKAHWKKASVKGMTKSEVDAFSTELLGFSLTSGIEAVKSGDSQSLEALVNTSASINGITPEHATQLMTKVFGL